MNNRKPSPLLMAALKNENKKNQLITLLRRQFSMKIMQKIKRFMTSQKTKNNLKKGLIVFGLMAVLTEPAYAGTSIPILDTVIQWLVDVLTGTLARLIAIITVVHIGYKLRKEEISGKLAAIEIGGIAIVMASTTIVDSWGIF